MGIECVIEKRQDMRLERKEKLYDIRPHKAGSLILKTMGIQRRKYSCAEII